MKKWMTPEVEELEINETACTAEGCEGDNHKPGCVHYVPPVDNLSGAKAN